MRVRVDARTGRAAGDPTLVFSGLKQSTKLDLTPDGRTLVFAQAPVNDQVWTMTVAGPPERRTATPTALTSGSLERGRLDLSPDGQWVAFAQRDGGGGSSYSYNIHVAPFAGGPSRAVVATAAHESNPRWSPDGRRLAYVLRDSTGLSIMAWDQASGRVERLDGGIPAPLVYFKPLDWSGDGATLVYPADGGRQLAALRVADGVRTLLPPLDGGSFVGWAVSPDGREVAAAQMAGTSEWFRLWRLRPPNGSWERVDGPEGDAVPLRWADDGWLYLWVDYASDRLPEVWRVRAAGGQPERYVRVPVRCAKADLAISRDARRLACVASQTSPDVWLASNLDARAR
jgi:dipeptidyl aminopeptidase/acylaminoacyl peptidase